MMMMMICTTGTSSTTGSTTGSSSVEIVTDIPRSALLLVVASRQRRRRQRRLGSIGRAEHQQQHQQQQQWWWWLRLLLLFLPVVVMVLLSPYVTSTTHPPQHRCTAAAMLIFQQQQQQHQRPMILRSNGKQKGSTTGSNGIPFLVLRHNDRHCKYRKNGLQQQRHAENPNKSTTTGSTSSSSNTGSTQPWNDDSSSNIDLSLIEAHVIAKAQSQVDTSRVLQALSADEPTAQMWYNTNANTNFKLNEIANADRSIKSTTSTGSNWNFQYFNNQSPSQLLLQQQQPARKKLSTTTTTGRTEDLLYDYEKEDHQHQRPMSQYQISTAAAIACGTITLITLHNTYIAILVSVSIFITALLDDTNDGLSGALARIVGRTTIRSVQASQPKLKAIARVVITGDEQIQNLQETIRMLQTENQLLQQENTTLRQWKERQLHINHTIVPLYTLPQLKTMAKSHNLTVSGSKIDLIERLIDANVIPI